MHILDPVRPCIQVAVLAFLVAQKADINLQGVGLAALKGQSLLNERLTKWFYVV
jgi:hypothetical protein